MSTQKQDLKIYTWQQVSKHNTPEDLWLVIGDYVYDVTKYSQQHPGGPIVLANRAGRNASLAFQQASHSVNAVENVMPNHRIGKIEKDSVMEQWQKEIEGTGSNIIIGVLVLLAVLVGIYFVAM